MLTLLSWCPSLVAVRPVSSPVSSTAVEKAPVSVWAEGEDGLPGEGEAAASVWAEAAGEAALALEAALRWALLWAVEDLP